MEDEPVQMPELDVEEEISKAISAIGGRRVQDATGKKPQFENADFVFDTDRVLAELKCLETDQISSEAFVIRATEIFERYQSKLDRPLGVGRFRISTEGKDPELQREIAELYANPIARAALKADRQISATAEHFGGEWSGLLILVNNNNTALDPIHIKWSLGHIFQKYELPRINHVLAFTVNMSTTHQHEGRDVHAWMSLAVNPNRPNLHNFTAKFHDAWCRHIANNFGSVSLIPGDEQMLASLRNRPPKKERPPNG